MSREIIEAINSAKHVVKETGGLIALGLLAMAEQLARNEENNVRRLRGQAPAYTEDNVEGKALENLREALQAAGMHPPRWIK